MKWKLVAERGEVDYEENKRGFWWLMCLLPKQECIFPAPCQFKWFVTVNNGFLKNTRTLRTKIRNKKGNKTAIKYPSAAVRGWMSAMSGFIKYYDYGFRYTLPLL